MAKKIELIKLFIISKDGVFITLQIGIKILLK
jgi:hypothetical protein